MTRKELPKYCYPKGRKGYVYFQRRGAKTGKLHHPKRGQRPFARRPAHAAPGTKTCRAPSVKSDSDSAHVVPGQRNSISRLRGR